MTPYERTIQFLNDMNIKYEETINGHVNHIHIKVDISK